MGHHGSRSQASTGKAIRYIDAASTLQLLCRRRKCMPLPACYATAAVAHAYQRLGEIWEERGRVDRAAEYCGRLVSLMKEPDPALRPRVELATRALERHVGTLSVTARPEPLSIEVHTAAGDPVQNLVFAEDGNVSFAVGNQWRCSSARKAGRSTPTSEGKVVSSSH